MADQEKEKKPVSNTVEHHHGDEHDPNDDHTHSKYLRRIVIPMDTSPCSLHAFNGTFAILF